MKTLLIAVTLFSASLCAQYAPSASGSTTAAAEINGKPNYQLSGTSGCAAVNGTVGKDICTDSAGKVYVPSVTGTPATWVQIPTLPLTQSTSGNAATATALAATPTLCTTGQAPTGVLANGNATGCATAGSCGLTSAIVTGSRALGTVYQNTTGCTMTVVGFLLAGGSAQNIVCTIGSTASPVTQTWLDTAPGSGYGVPFVCAVPVNWYYEVTGGASPTLTSWQENH